MVTEIKEDPENAFIDFMALKYAGAPKYTGNRPVDERVVVVVEPEKTTSMG